MLTSNIPVHPLFPHTGCPHEFRHGNTECIDYCSYIQVPGLLALCPDIIQSPDEKLFYSLLATTALWWHLQTGELAALSQMHDSAPLLSLEQYQSIHKRIERCLAIDAILEQQWMLAYKDLINQDPAITFSVLFEQPFEPARSLAQYTNQLTQQPSFVLNPLAADQTTRLHLEHALHKKFLMHQKQFMAISQQWDYLLKEQGQKNGKSTIRLDDLINLNQLLSLSTTTLSKHHPHAALELDKQEPPTYDELTFLFAHQISELWMNAALAALHEACNKLTQLTPRLLLAVSLVNRVRDILGLFTCIIQIPRTMLAADYLEFRYQLRGGSGAESVQFRALEILMGQRDPRYYQTLHRMHLLTPQLRQLWEIPSLHTAFLRIAQQRGILDAASSLEHKAQQLTMIFRPTGFPNPHMDLAVLGEVLLDLEEQLDAWRYHHLKMVDRMIGSQRPSMGLAGQPAQGKTDSKPYLVRTFSYQRVFPELWHARNLLLAKTDPIEKRPLAERRNTSDKTLTPSVPDPLDHYPLDLLAHQQKQTWPSYNQNER